MESILDTMQTEEQHKRLSKYLSLVLRHEPEKLGLHLSDDGFVPLAVLMAAMKQKKTWDRVTETQIREVVRLSDKQRFEIVGENIRARYGHSVPQAVTYPAIEPPEILYHGTSPKSLAAIREQGLLSMDRQYVHLSSVIEQARIVGRRHANVPVILVVRAQDAARAGVTFHQPEPRLYLSSPIPPEFLSEMMAESSD